LSDFANRFSGSADLYEATGRTPSASINFVTSHDGYTLADLVSYQETHNEANGEENRDGEKNNLSWNCGVEGQTEDEEINKLRRRQQRNFLATLFLSQGVPMLAGGDEYGRSQQGNNNAYCQDNEISWLNWEHGEHADRLTQFAAELAAFRKRHAAFRRLDFFRGQPVRGTNMHDVKWLNPTGRKMRDDEWNVDHNRCLGIFLSGYLMGINGKIIEDDFYLLCFNAHHEPVPFVLPAGVETEWEFVLDTADEKGFVRDRTPPKGQIILEGRSMMVLRLRPPAALERSTIMDRLLQSMDGEAKDAPANEQQKQ
jgi:glycogen operon protein